MTAERARSAPVDPDVLTSIVKAYDVRGVVPDQLDAQICRDVGAAFVQLLSGRRCTCPGVVVGHDMRPTSPELSRCFRRGCCSRWRRRHDDRSGQHRPALLRVRTPRPAGCDVHCQPQPGRSTTASSCAGPTLLRSARRPVSVRSGIRWRPASRTCRSCARKHHRARHARRLRRAPALSRRPERCPAPDRGRRCR